MKQPPTQELLSAFKGATRGVEGWGWGGGGGGDGGLGGGGGGVVLAWAQAES